MRIGIVSTQVPFVTGGAERHAASLGRALRERGHEAAEISIPFKWYPARTLVDHVLAAKLVDLSVFEGAPIDLLVGLKFPAYLARHPNKVYWLLHQHRQAYDFWEAGTSDLLFDADGPAARELIRGEDRAALGAAGARVYANSRNVAARLSRHLGLESTPLYHPPPLADRLRAGSYGDYIFVPSRINPAKRQDLVLDALAKTHTPVRIVFAGPADSEAYLAGLKDKAAALGLAGRVEWWGGIDDDTMVRAYAEARAVLFAPVDEDYGYITLEAMLAARPVITVEDAGGPLEFVEDGRHGLVTAAEPAALAGAMDRMSEDPALAERLGAAGLERYRQAGIGWDRVVDVLTGRPGGSVAASGTSPERPVELTAVPPGPDLAGLRACLRPPVPADPPFATVLDVLRAYDLRTTEAAAAYFQTHWKRYLATLALLQEEPVRHLLDVGVFPPFVFQALLKAALPAVTLDGVWEGPQPFAQTVESRSAHPDFDMVLRPANVECEPMPFADARFDAVLAMEIFEHFALNPLFFLREAARVLEPGGRLILTTPNVVSHRGVRKVLDGVAPYSFGLFIPTGGVYGRHNREYTPHEVASLAEAAGFTTVRLLTADVYDDDVHEGTARLLMDRGDDFSMRGENILYVGRKEPVHPARPNVRPLPAPPPPNLYHGDPLQLAARLSVVTRDEATGMVTIRLENRSAARWPCEGPWAAALLLEWTDEFGDLVHGGCSIALPAPVFSGESLDMTLALDPEPSGAATGTVSVEMFQEGAGRFAGAGQANILRLACSEVAFRALTGL